MLSALIPSHDVAQLLLSLVHRLLDAVGLGHTPVLEQIIYVIIIALIAIFLGYGLQKLGVFIARRIISMRKSQFLHGMLEHRVIQRVLAIITPLVFLALIPFAFDSSSPWLSALYKIAGICALIAFGRGLNAVITLAWDNYNERANKANHPLKGVANVAHGIVWIIIGIIIASIIIGKSPMTLLAGLGAFAAALMLIFKDSILGFVAGLQLSSNDMLRVGDWIVVPSTIANGVVVDVSLTVVKVQNWDNTIVMLPPYTLVSTSFQNWRGMSESGVRQIDRQVIIDNTSIHTLTAADIDTLVTRYPLLADFVTQRRQLAAKGNNYVFNGGTAPVNGTIDTNLGLYRAYLCQYLLAHPAISNDWNIIVRLMNPTEAGTPLDIYCFTNTTEWLAYEAIRSQIFEHIAASAPDFGIRIFNTTDAGALTLARS